MKPNKTEQILIDLALSLDPEPWDKVPDIYAAFQAYLMRCRTASKLDTDLQKLHKLAEFLAIKSMSYHA